MPVGRALDRISGIAHFQSTRCQMACRRRVGLKLSPTWLGELMDRRDFLKLASGSMAGLMIPFPLLAASGQGISSIDAHCHIFNGSDLPLAPFAFEVFLHASPGSPLELLTAPILRLIQGAAPRAKAELKGLRGRREWRQVLDDPEARDRLLQMRDVQGLDQDTDRRFADLWAKISRWHAKDHARFFEAYGQAMRARGVDDGLAGSLFAPGIAGRVADDPDLVNDLVAQEMQAGHGLIDPKGGLAFLKTLVRSRYSNALTLAALHDGSQGPRTDILVAALVDFDLWIGVGPCRAYKSSMKDQVELAAAIAEKSGGHVRFMAPFNPLRAAVSRGYFEEVAVAAAQSSGCLGFKLYPQMGFSPSANEEGLVPRRWRTRKIKAADIDQAMARLFELCASRGLSILAHGGPTNSPQGSAERARQGSPGAWAQAIKDYPEYFGGDSPRVKVCLAHMGGIDTRHHGLNWGEQIVALMKSHPCLYADLSFLPSLMGDHPDMRGRLHPLLRDDRVRDRLLYGSDWSMLALEGDIGGYPAGIEAFLRKVGFSDAQVEAVFSGNARRFFQFRGMAG
jgi:predicted TIM-barrel fold metal-dependent hydrolase